METYYLQIAGLSFCNQVEQKPRITSRFRPFLVDTDRSEYSVVFKKVDSLAQPEEPKVYENEESFVCCHEKDGMIRYFSEELDKSQGMRSIYARTIQNYKNNVVTIEYLEKGVGCLSDITSCFSHVDLESILIREQRMFLHASCVNTPLGGLLFSGPSGIGKSTQSDLWCKNRDAKLINGDRPILQRTEDGWKAWGAPYTGSSTCYVNESCPITAIIMLKQSDNCSLRRLTIGEAFRAVWSGLTVHTWDNFFMETASNLTLDLIDKVPVYEFCCTCDDSAVDFLEQAIRKDLNL